MAHLWMINLLKKTVQLPEGCKEQIWIKQTRTGDVSKLGIGRMSFGYGFITKHDIDVWSFSWFDSWSSFFGSIFGYIEYLHHSHAWDVHGTIFRDKWEDTVCCIYRLIWYRLIVSARSVAGSLVTFRQRFGVFTLWRFHEKMAHGWFDDKHHDDPSAGKVVIFQFANRLMTRRYTLW